MKRKRKNRDDESFRLQEENRQLKNLNRSLLKQLKKANKGINRIDLETIEPDYEEKQESTKEKTCSNCGKGTLSQTKVRHLTFETCNLCEYRNKV